MRTAGRGEGQRAPRNTANRAGALRPQSGAPWPGTGATADRLFGTPPRRHRPLPQGEPAHKEQRAPCRGRWAERPPNERTQNRARDPPWEQSHCRGHWSGGDHTRQGGPTAITGVLTGRGTAGRRHMGRGCVTTEAETGWCAYQPGGAKDGRRPPGAARNRPFRPRKEPAVPSPQPALPPEPGQKQPPTCAALLRWPSRHAPALCHLATLHQLGPH